ncbi:Amidohydrolase 3 [Flavobacterium sp. 9R]|uniref:amidohydrolase n=1 Tax=Flavobacterium sp. 9R TaxID=2653143 RepID=UPI0012F0409C|nr:amidohydrolase [Flavobacterium sp. 9R]VXB16481.1 Amidohydrolase 3 [Flavobacterium sp. 9R]
MKNWILSLAGLLFFGVCIAKTKTPIQQTNQGELPTLYYGGNIITMEGKQEKKAEAVVTMGTKIVFVGSLKAAQKKYKNLQKIDLKGQTMMPGFIEQHLHPLLGALFLTMPAIAPEDWQTPTKLYKAALTREAYMAKLKDEFANRKDKTGVFYSWGYQQLWHGPLTRSMLDEVSATIPIAIWHRSCHEFFVNSAFLKKYDIDEAAVAKAPEDARKQINFEKGHFYENGAMVYLLPKIFADFASPEKMKEGVGLMVKYLHHNGVTAYNEPGALLDASLAKLYNDELNKANVPMLSTFIAEGNTTYMSKGDGALAMAETTLSTFPKGGKVFFLPKQVKLLMDGSIISQLMQMKAGYTDGHQGEWMLKPELMEKATKLFWDAGYQIHIHVNGDEGLEVLLGCIERRMKENPRKDHRTVIVHFANSTDEQVKKLAALGCIVSANPYYVTGFSEKFSQYGLGQERAESMVRIGPAEKLGVSISLHSDLPMAPSNPLYLVWCAVTRKADDGKQFRPDLAISRHKAIQAITINAAYSWRMEDKIGSIKVGKEATFTFLDKNPYQVAIDDLKNIQVKATVFQGKMFPVEN